MRRLGKCFNIYNYLNTTFVLIMASGTMENREKPGSYFFLGPSDHIGPFRQRCRISFKTNDPGKIGEHFRVRVVLIRLVKSILPKILEKLKKVMVNSILQITLLLPYHYFTITLSLLYHYLLPYHHVIISLPLSNH